MKAYVLVFNYDSTQLPNRDAMLEFLETRAEIYNWYSPFSHAVIIISDKSTKYLTNRIHAAFPNVWFTIFQVNNPDRTINGWLDQESWDFINYPNDKSERE